MIYVIKLLTAAIILLSISACSTFTEVVSSTSSTADTVTPDITLNSFIEKRYIAIRQDAANGGGENLDVLAQLLGKEDKKAFAKLMQSNFDGIFTGIGKPLEILARIESRTTDNG